MIRHAGLIALRRAGRWRGALIEGPSGAGKSDLALRALAEGLRLVADDRTLVWISGGRLFGRAPGPLAGLIEVRGLGIVPVSALAFTEIALLVRCVSAPGQVERTPDRSTQTVLGTEVARLDLWPFEPAAAVKLARALEHLGEPMQEAYQACLAPPAGALGVKGLTL